MACVCAARLLRGEVDVDRFTAWFVHARGIDIATAYPGVPVALVADLFRWRYARHVMIDVIMGGGHTLAWTRAFELAERVLIDVRDGYAVAAGTR